MRSLFAVLAAAALALALAVAAPAAPKRAPSCSPAKKSRVTAEASRKARRVIERTRMNPRSARVLRATYIAEALRRAGCAKAKPADPKKPAKPGGDDPQSTDATGTDTDTGTGDSRGSGSTKVDQGSGATTKPAKPQPLPTTGTGQQPTTTPQPQPNPTPIPAAWQFGVQAGAADYDARVSAALGAKVARVEFEIATPASQMRAVIGEYADKGIRVLPLAGFWGRTPTVAESRNLAGWAAEFGPGGTFWKTRPAQAQLPVKQIEFGNETSYAYQGTQKRGGEYALRARDAAQAVKAANPNVGLLIQADNANQSDNWVGQMYAAVPNIHEYAAGWTVHPYGPETRWRNRIDDVINYTARYGASATIPIAVTEWGLATDDGRCLDDNYGWNRCMTYQQAADALQTSVGAMRLRYGTRIGLFIIYHGRDLRARGISTGREDYFGLLNYSEGAKGPLTTVARGLFAG